MEPYDTNRKGAIAEAEIAAAAVTLGASVLRPISEHGRYDLVFEIGGQTPAGPVQVGGARGRSGHPYPA